MGIIRAFIGSISGTFADQWKDIFTADQFDELTVVAPAVLQQSSNWWRSTENKATSGIISNGSKIFVPENTAAFVFSQSGIEDIIIESGGYVYESGQASIFDGDGIGNSIFDQIKDRFAFGGQPSDQKHIAFVNLREIRGIKFGTRGPLIYHDLFYGVDLEILAFGKFSLKVVDAEKFIKNFVPANVDYYTFGDSQARAQILSEFRQSFADALNSLSTKYRISQLPSQANAVTACISGISSNAGTWNERFGFKVVSVGIENIELTPESRELVRQYSANKMNLKAYEEISQRASNIAAQQKIAQGVQNHGLGDGGGMVLGMNMAQSMNPQTAEPMQQKVVMSLDEQIETLKKMKELLDAGILSKDEFDAKKKEIMGLKDEPVKKDEVPASPSKWYYLNKDQSHGPFAESELLILLKGGILTRETYVFDATDKNFGKDWVMAKDTKLANLFT